MCVSVQARGVRGDITLKCHLPIPADKEQKSPSWSSQPDRGKLSRAAGP